MSAFTGFCDSDTLIVAGIDYNVDGPAQVAGAKTRPRMCIEKPAGEVGFKLSALRHLGLYANVEVKVTFDDSPPEPPYYNPDIVLDLVPDGPPVAQPGGRVRQAFIIDQQPGVDIRYTGFDVHVDSVKGRIVLDLVERDPWAAVEGCNREPRYVRADFTSVPGESSLEIQGSAVGFGATLWLKDLAFGGGAAASGFDVGIGIARTECGIVGVVPGGEQQFWASVAKVPVGYARTFAWTVAGATIVGPANLPHVKVALSALPDPDPDPVHVSVRVEVAGIAAVAAVDFKPDTPAASRSRELRCRVQRHLWHNFRADPLWDPLRDYAVKPFTRAEIERLRDFAAGLLRDTERVLENERR